MLTRLDAVERRQITDQAKNDSRFDEIFVIGASLKDAARQTFSAIRIGPELIPGLLNSLHKSASDRKEYGVIIPSKRR